MESHRNPRQRLEQRHHKWTINTRKDGQLYSYEGNKNQRHCKIMPYTKGSKTTEGYIDEHWRYQVLVKTLSNGTHTVLLGGLISSMLLVFFFFNQHALRLHNSILMYLPGRVVHIYSSIHTNTHVQSSNFIVTPNWKPPRCLSTLE